MIELHRVTKAYGRGANHRIVCAGIDAVFDGRADVGILGTNGSGKSTLLRLIAGMERPDSGQVVRRARVSFPISYSGGFHPHLSARDNTRFIARMYGADTEAVIRFARDFSELGAHFDEPLCTYSNTMRSRVTFAASIAFEFDVYLVDEITSVGDVAFKRKCLAALAERRRHARIIMVSQSAHTIGRMCSVGGILDNGLLHAFPTMAEAMRVYQDNFAVTDA